MRARSIYGLAGKSDLSTCLEHREPALAWPLGFHRLPSPPIVAGPDGPTLASVGRPGSDRPEVDAMQVIDAGGACMSRHLQVPGPWTWWPLQRLKRPGPARGQ